MTDSSAAAHIRSGLTQARTHWRLVLLVWALFLLLAWIAALPAWRWFDRALSLAPEGDRLLDGLNVALIRELFHYDRSPTPAIALGSIWTLVVAALLVNPFVAGGTLGLLLSRDAPGQAPDHTPHDAPDLALDDAPLGVPASAFRIPFPAPGLTRRFVAHAMHFYWRFARVLIVAGAIGLLVGASLVALLTGLSDELNIRGLERSRLGVQDLRILIALALFFLTSVVIDLARIRIVQDDDPRAWVHVRGAIAFLRRHIGACLGLTLAFLTLTAAAALFYALAASLVTPRSWIAIALAIAWQQAFAFTRTWLRVAMLAGEAALVSARSAPPRDMPPFVPVPGPTPSLAAANRPQDMDL